MRSTPKGEEVEWIEPFLEAYSRHGSIATAACEIGVAESTIYAEKARNADFAAQVQMLRERCIQDVEATLYRRAKSGASDTAIIFFLKGRRPEVWGEGHLRAEEAERIRAEERQRVLGELRAEINAQEDPAARKALLAVVPT